MHNKTYCLRRGDQTNCNCDPFFQIATLRYLKVDQFATRNDDNMNFFYNNEEFTTFDRSNNNLFNNNLFLKNITTTTYTKSIKAKLIRAVNDITFALCEDEGSLGVSFPQASIPYSGSDPTSVQSPPAKVR